MTKYYNKVTAATADSADGVKLPAPSVNDHVVVVNGTSVPVEVFPHGASAEINSGGSGGSVTLAAFSRLHFVTNETGVSANWRTAQDNGIQ
jgi:hypothetical protein